MADKKPKETQAEKAKRLVRRVFGVGSSADVTTPDRKAEAFAGDPNSAAGKLKAAREKRKKMLDEI